MPPTVNEFWKKLNANEKMVMYGAGAIVVAFLLGLVASRGFGGYGSYDLVGAIVVGVIYWLKYSPNKMTWPAPIPTIVLVITGISAIFAVLGAIGWLGFFSLDLFAIAIIVNAVGAVVMAWYAYKEYQAMPKTSAPTPPAPPAPPAA